MCHDANPLAMCRSPFKIVSPFGKWAQNQSVDIPRLKRQQHFKSLSPISALTWLYIATKTPIKPVRKPISRAFLGALLNLKYLSYSAVAIFFFSRLFGGRTFSC